MSGLRRILALVMMVALLLPLPARADSPAQSVVRGLYSQLVAAMKQGEQLGFDGRYKKLAPVIHASFNLPLMTKVAVGLSWSSASPQQQSDLTSAFTDFSIATYASRFAAYDGEQFTVTGETTSTDGVIVETTLKPRDSAAIALNYLMRKDDKGHYRIVDVYLNGAVSELATRRGEFSSIAQREGIPALITSLGQKSHDLGAS